MDQNRVYTRNGKVCYDLAGLTNGKSLWVSSGGQKVNEPFTYHRQDDLFKPRKMSDIHTDSHERVRPQTSLVEFEWRCEYCQMMNDGKNDICAHCGAPR